MDYYHSVLFRESEAVISGVAFLFGTTTTLGTAGLSGAAVLIELLNTFVLTAVNTVAAPMMSSAFQSGRPEQVRRILYGEMLLSFLGACHCSR